MMIFFEFCLLLVWMIDVCHHYQRRLADVIALNNNGWFYCHLFYFYWLLLLPHIVFVADVPWPLSPYPWRIAYGGRCYCHLCEWALKFILMVPKVVGWCSLPMFLSFWHMLWPLLPFMAGVIAMFNDGIATCVNGLIICLPYFWFR